jgi:hypothetical protein
MKRYRIRLGYPRGRQVHEYVWADDAVVDEGTLFFHDAQDKVVAIYKPGFWTIVREVS